MCNAVRPYSFVSLILAPLSNNSFSSSNELSAAAIYFKFIKHQNLTK